jgi:ribosomal protein S18 acetylase RimI-like enzyme
MGDLAKASRRKVDAGFRRKRRENKELKQVRNRAICVRQAAPEDAETLFDIRTSVRQNHQSREELYAHGVTPATVAASLAGAHTGWIAEIEGVPAAFTLIDRDKGLVFALFVRPEREGLGLGSMLLDIAERALFETYEGIWLETGADKETRANGFYRSHGWVLAKDLGNGSVRYEKTRPGDRVVP